MASANGELNFKFYLILINLNKNRSTWLVATTLDNAGKGLDHGLGK